MSAPSSSSSSGSSSRAAPRRDDHRPAKLRQAPAETRRRKRTNSLLRIVIAAEPSQASTSTPRRPQARAAQSRAEQGRAGKSSQAPRSMETHARTHASLAVEAEAAMRVPVRPQARPVGHLRQTSCSLAYLPASVPAGVPAWFRRGASSGAAAQSSRGRQSEASSFLLDPGAGPGYLWEAYLSSDHS